MVRVTGDGREIQNNAYAAGPITLLDNGADPTAEGEITRSGADVKIYAGGKVVSIAGITAQNGIATAEPGSNDDTTAGWAPGSIIVDTTNGKAYICVDATEGAAVWIKATLVAADVVSDDVYAAGWDGLTGVAPSKNAVYDKFESMAVTQIVSGTYPGDGSLSQAITGLGIRPVWISIARRHTADVTNSNAREWLTTWDQVIDDNVNGMAISNASWNLFEDNRIIAFGADGFTVDDNGNNDSPNENAATFNFVAIGS